MRAAVASVPAVSRRKRSTSLSPVSRVCSARSRSSAGATSGAMRYSGRGSSLAPAAKNAFSISSVQAIDRRMRMGRWASKISAEASRMRVTSDSGMANARARLRHRPTPTRIPGGTE